MEKQELTLDDWVQRTPVELKGAVRALIVARVNVLKAELAELVNVLQAMNTKDSQTLHVLQDAALDVEHRECTNCVAGGDRSHKHCQLRTDTGIIEGWYCDPCYEGWKNTL